MDLKLRNALFCFRSTEPENNQHNVLLRRVMLQYAWNRNYLVSIRFLLGRTRKSEGMFSEVWELNPPVIKRTPDQPNSTLPFQSLQSFSIPAFPVVQDPLTVHSKQNPRVSVLGVPWNWTQTTQNQLARDITRLRWFLAFWPKAQSSCWGVYLGFWMFIWGGFSTHFWLPFLR